MSVLLVQVTVYVASGGNSLVKVEALRDDGIWQTIHDSWLLSTSTVIEAKIVVNPCQTVFRSDTLRLTFDTDIGSSWLEVSLGANIALL